MISPRQLLVTLTLSLSLAVGISASWAAEVPRGYIAIAKRAGVPSTLLYAVALNESRVKTNRGRVIPWPWTMNHAGKGYYFASRKELYAEAQRLTAAGVRLFDLGPAQVNWRWHSERFESLWAATDPYVNLTTGAAILAEEYRRTGDWWTAVGRYHSPGNAGRAANYARNVRAKWERLRQ